METKRIVSNCGGKSINKSGKNKNLEQKKKIYIYIIWGAHALAMFLYGKVVTRGATPAGVGVLILLIESRVHGTNLFPLYTAAHTQAVHIPFWETGFHGQ